MGIQLMQKGIEEARAKGHRAMILVGDLPYYQRVGFAPIKRGSVKFPGPVDPSRMLGLALVEGALDTLEGIVKRARIDHPVSARTARSWVRPARRRLSERNLATEHRAGTAGILVYRNTLPNRGSHA